MLTRLLPICALSTAAVLLTEPSNLQSQEPMPEQREVGPAPRQSDIDPFVAKLIEVVQNKNITWEKGANACVALGKQGRKAVPALPAVKEFLERYLAQFSAITDYQKAANDDEWLAKAVQGCGEFGLDGDMLSPTIERVLTVQIRGRFAEQVARFTKANCAAAVALGKLGSPKSLPALVKAATEEKESVIRTDVVTGLAHMVAVNASAPDVVHQVVIRLRVIYETDEVDNVKSLAAKMLAQIEEKKAEGKEKKAAAKKP